MDARHIIGSNPQRLFFTYPPLPPFVRGGGGGKELISPLGLSSLAFSPKKSSPSAQEIYEYFNIHHLLTPYLRDWLPIFQEVPAKL